VESEKRLTSIKYRVQSIKKLEKRQLGLPISHWACLSAYRFTSRRWAQSKYKYSSVNSPTVHGNLSSLRAKRCYLMNFSIKICTTLKIHSNWHSLCQFECFLFTKNVSRT